MANLAIPPCRDVLSFPKIISGHIGGAVQPGSEWRGWRQSVGLLDAAAHLSVMSSAVEEIAIGAHGFCQLQGGEALSLGVRPGFSTAKYDNRRHPLLRYAGRVPAL